MTDLIKKFSEAAKTVSSKKDPMRECVYGAYHNHLRDINSEILPEDIQIIYDAVSDRLTSVKPPGDIGNDEADHLAKDILYMASAVKAQYRP